MAAKKTVKDEEDFNEFIEEKKSNDSKFVLVLNNLKHFLGVPIKIPTKSREEGYIVKNLVLYPGFNEVPLNIWEEAEKHPFFIHHMDEESIVYRGDKGFFDLGKEKQVKVIQKIYDRTLLINLKNQTREHDLIAAFSEQIEKIQGRIVK